jgi:phage tail-like protein
MLPAVYAEDDFTWRFLAGLDEIVAPVFAVLDCFDAYLDPALAPPDHLDWLADWVALPMQEGWSLERRRRLVAIAVMLHRRRGTRAGLAELIGTVTGGRVEITESGGCAASYRPGGDMPGADQPSLHVRVYLPDPAAVRFGRIDALVAEHKPAHVPHTLEIVPERGSEVSR